MSVASSIFLSNANAPPVAASGAQKLVHDGPDMRKVSREHVLSLEHEINPT